MENTTKTVYRFSQVETKELCRRLRALESLWTRKKHSIEELNKKPFHIIYSSYDKMMQSRFGNFSAREWVNVLSKM